MKPFAIVSFVLFAAVMGALHLFAGIDTGTLLMASPLLIAMDIAKVREAARAGHAGEILRQWAEAGISFDERLGVVTLMHKPAQDVRMFQGEKGWQFAADAQPE